MATTYEFFEQNVLVFTATFTDEATGALIDPSYVAFGFRVNAGATTTYTYGSGQQIQRIALGEYQCQIDTTGKAGIWVWEWQSTGTGQASISGSLTVKPAPMSLL